MFKWAARVWVIILTGAFVVSLSFNVAVVAFASFSSMVASAYDAVTGTASAYSTLRNRAQAAEVEVDDLIKEKDLLLREADELDGRLTQAIRRSDELYEQVELRNVQNSRLTDDVISAQARIADFEDELRLKNARLSGLLNEIEDRDDQIRELVDDLARPRGSDIVDYRGARITLANAVTDTNARIARRTVAAAARNSSSIVAQSIPYLGIAVVLGITAYDLKDSCDTTRDLHALDVAIDPSKEFGADETAVCGLRVPTKDEVWEDVKSGSFEAWQDAGQYLPALPEYELPSWRDLAFWP